MKQIQFNENEILNIMLRNKNNNDVVILIEWIKDLKEEIDKLEKHIDEMYSRED